MKIGMCAPGCNVRARPPLLPRAALSIFVTAPMVTFGTAGFPFLSLAGQFLLKDLALAAGALTLVAQDAARHAAGEDMSMPRMRAELTELRRRVDAMDAPAS